MRKFAKVGEEFVRESDGRRFIIVSAKLTPEIWGRSVMIYRVKDKKTGYTFSTDDRWLENYTRRIAI